jgi:hypothetical protein
MGCIPFSKASLHGGLHHFSCKAAFRVSKLEDKLGLPQKTAMIFVFCITE